MPAAGMVVSGISVTPSPATTMIWAQSSLSLDISDSIGRSRSWQARRNAAAAAQSGRATSRSAARSVRRIPAKSWNLWPKGNPTR